MTADTPSSELTEQILEAEATKEMQTNETESDSPKEPYEDPGS